MNEKEWDLNESSNEGQHEQVDKWMEEHEKQRSFLQKYNRYAKMCTKGRKQQKTKRGE